MARECGKPFPGNKLQSPGETSAEQIIDATKSTEFSDPHQQDNLTQSLYKTCFTYLDTHQLRYYSRLA